MSVGSYAQYPLCTVPVMHSTRYTCHILMNLELSWYFFEKYLNRKFHQDPSTVGRIVPCGQTDRHDEANICFSQFSGRA
jgi:hypothetical protein